MCDILLHHSLPFLPHINSERGTGRRGGGEERGLKFLEIGEQCAAG